MKNHCFVAAKILFISVSFSLRAQVVTIDQALKLGRENAQIYFDSYMDDIGDALSYSAVSHWVHSAQARPRWGFELGGRVSFMLIPRKVRHFSFDSARYTNLRLISGDDEVPTLFGPDKSSARIGYSVTYQTPQGSITENGQIQAPSGFDLERAFSGHVLPAGFLQFDLGVLRNVELKLRFAPNFGRKEFRTLAFGAGVLHSLSDYASEKAEFPVDLGIFLGYMFTQNSWALAPSDIQKSSGSALQVRSNIATFTMVAERELGRFSIYGAAGLDFLFTEATLKGTYEYSLSAFYNEIFTDPLDSQSRRGFLHAEAGAVLKLSFLHISAGYSFQRFSSFQAGVSIPWNPK
ncbi:MAG: hypothetical protein MI784_17125 [Cytophagales bacterium]|nr:hypothetical protein [Cytophagales bacterium]